MYTRIHFWIVSFFCFLCFDFFFQSIPLPISDWFNYNVWFFFGYVLISSKASRPLFLVFFFIPFLAILRSLFFYMNFKIILSYLKRELCWNSNGNFCIQWLVIFLESCHFYISIAIQHMVCPIFVQISFYSFYKIL